jgi:hypothetical protein
LRLGEGCQIGIGGQPQHVDKRKVGEVLLDTGVLATWRQPAPGRFHLHAGDQLCRAAGAAQFGRGVGGHALDSSIEGGLRHLAQQVGFGRQTDVLRLEAARKGDDVASIGFLHCGLGETATESPQFRCLLAARQAIVGIGHQIYLQPFAAQVLDQAFLVAVENGVGALAAEQLGPRQLLVNGSNLGALAHQVDKLDGNWHLWLWGHQTKAQHPGTWGIGRDHRRRRRASGADCRHCHQQQTTQRPTTEEARHHLLSRSDYPRRFDHRPRPRILIGCLHHSKP